MSDLPPIRNARLVRDGVIDCEIDHPSLGWIPFAAIEGDDGLSGAVYAASIATAVDDRQPPEEPYLTRRQWDRMLNLGGLRLVLNQCLDAIDAQAQEPEDRAAFADLYDMAHHSGRYHLSTILALVSEYADVIEQVTGSVPTEQQITDAFEAAMAWEG